MIDRSDAPAIAALVAWPARSRGVSATRQVARRQMVVLNTGTLGWLPTLDTFRTFLASNSESSPLANLLHAAVLPGPEVSLHV
jgi:hypothetical protein